MFDILAAIVYVVFVDGSEVIIAITYSEFIDRSENIDCAPARSNGLKRSMRKTDYEYLAARPIKGTRARISAIQSAAGLRGDRLTISAIICKPLMIHLDVLEKKYGLALPKVSKTAA